MCIRDRAGGGDHTCGFDRLAGRGAHQVAAVDGGHVRDFGVGADIEAEAGGEPFEVGGDLVAAGVVVGVGGQGPVAGDGAEASRGEDAQAVVVVRPGACRAGPGLEHERAEAGGAGGASGGQAGLAGADDHEGFALCGHASHHIVTSRNDEMKRR